MKLRVYAVRRGSPSRVLVYVNDAYAGPLPRQGEAVTVVSGMCDATVARPPHHDLINGTVSVSVWDCAVGDEVGYPEWRDKR